MPGRSRCSTLSVYKHLYHLSVSCISLCVVIICFVQNISFKNPLTCLLFSGYLLMYVTSSLGCSALNLLPPNIFPSLGGASRSRTQTYGTNHLPIRIYLFCSIFR